MTVLFFFSFLFHYIFPFRVIYLVLFIILGTVLLIRMGIFDCVIIFGSYVRNCIFVQVWLIRYFMTMGSLSLRFIILQEKGDKKIGIVSFVHSLSSFAIYFVIFYSLLNVVYIRGIFVVSVCQGLFSYMLVRVWLYFLFLSSHIRVCQLVHFSYSYVAYSHHF